MVDDGFVDTAVIGLPAESGKEVDAEAEEDIGGFSRADVRHNMKFLIMMDVIMLMGWADFQVALLPLLVHLKASNFIIGIVQGATSAALFGVFVSPWISRKFRIKKWYLLVTNIVYTGPIGMAGLVVVMSRHLGLSNEWLLTFVMYMILAYQFVGGFCTLPGQEFMAACIPMSHRGRLFGYSFGLGSALAVGATALGGWIMYHYTAPMSFGYCFLITWFIYQSGMMLVVFAREKATPVEKSPAPWSKGMFKAAWDNKPYFRLQVTSVFFSVLVFPSLVFTSVYGLKELHMIPATMAIVGIVAQAVRMVSSTYAGILVDKLGARRMVQFAPLAPFLTLLPVVLVHHPFAIYASTAIWTALGNLLWNTPTNILYFGLPKPEDRSGQYTMQILVNSACGSLGPVAAGLLLDVFPYRTIFLIAMTLSIASFPLIRWLTSVLSDDARAYA